MNEAVVTWPLFWCKCARFDSHLIRPVFAGSGFESVFAFDSFAAVFFTFAEALPSTFGVAVVLAPFVGTGDLLNLCVTSLRVD